MDRNGALSQDEYDKALPEPARLRYSASSTRMETTSSLLPSCNEPSKSSPTRFNGFKFPNRLTLCRIRFSRGRDRSTVGNQPIQAAPSPSPSSPLVAPVNRLFQQRDPGLLARDLL